MFQFSRQIMYLFALLMLGGLSAVALPQDLSSITLKRRDDLASPGTVILDPKPIIPLSRRAPAAASTSLNPAKLLSRGIYTATACQIRDHNDCQYGQTEANCLGPGYSSWIVGCAGCAPNDNEIATPVVGDCPENRYCVEYRSQNDFNKASTDVECVREENFVSWSNLGTVGSSTGKYCSSGLQNNSKSNYKVNAYLSTYDEKLQYNVDAAALYIVITGGAADSTTNDYILSDSFVLPPGKSIQGCFTPQPNKNQILRATLGLIITT